MELRFHDYEQMIAAGFPEIVIASEERAGKGTVFQGLGSVFYDGTPRTEYVLWNDERRGKAVERMMDTAYDNSLKEGNELVVLYNHDPDKVLARRSSGDARFWKGKKGPMYEWDHDPEDDDHRLAKAKITKRRMPGSSVGFNIKAQKWKVEDGVTVREIHELELIEISPVFFPAYTATNVGMRSIGDENEAWKEFQRYETERRLKMWDQKHR